MILKWKRIGRLGRFFWFHIKPIQRVRLNSYIDIVECEKWSRPVVLRMSTGEYHVVSLSRNTTIKIVSFIERVTALSSHNLNSRLFPDGVAFDRKKKFGVGDNVEIWKAKAGWKIWSTKAGMSAALLSEEEFLAMRIIFAEILERTETQSSDALAEHPNDR
jgi:hypothetical protein